jgi:uncharacterized membrane protein
MKTYILLETIKRLSLLILLTGLLTAVSVGPAMAEPPTQVTCGSPITAPGQYVLVADCMGAGITITASHVHLKLNGHTMTGTGVSADGISATNVSHVHIEGPGTISSYFFGIVFTTVSDSHLEKVTVIKSHDFGLALTQQTTNTHVNNNVFSMNGVGGIFGDPTTSDNHLDNNQVINNNSFGGLGILLSSGATNYHINGNTALGHLFDLFDDNPNCDDNKWNGNTFVTSNMSCIH